MSSPPAASESGPPPTKKTKTSKTVSTSRSSGAPSSRGPSDAATLPVTAPSLTQDVAPQADPSLHKQLADLQSVVEMLCRNLHNN